MPAIDDLLGERLSEVENPDWYLSVFAQALEETGDAERAVVVADAMIEEHPHPPEDEFTRVMRLVASGGEKCYPRVKPSPFLPRVKALRAYRAKSGFTGKKEDSAGRTQCYSEGVHVSCDSPEVKDKEDDSGSEAEEPERPVEIQQREVEMVRGSSEYVRSWNFYDSDGTLFEQDIHILEGEYPVDPDDMDSEIITVYRWQSSQDGNITDQGDWVLSREEAEESGNNFAEESDQQEPEPEEEEEEEPEEDNEETASERQQEAEEAFGDMDESDLIPILGLPEDAILRISPVKPWMPTYSDDVPMDAVGIMVNVSHASFESCRQFFGIDEHGERFVRNEIQVIKKSHRGQGLGTKMFATQVEELSKAGYAYMRLHAAGSQGSKYNGYYTWPLFGYDQSMKSIRRHNPSLAAKIESEYPDAQSVLDVFKTPGGREWWLENGSDLHDARFDLSEGSRSREILALYLEEQKKKGK